MKLSKVAHATSNDFLDNLMIAERDKEMPKQNLIGKKSKHFAN